MSTPFGVTDSTTFTPAAAVVVGAGPGLGGAVVRRAAAAGTPVVAVARSADRLETLATEVEAETGTTVRPVVADATAADAPERVLEETARTVGPPEAVVCNLPGPDDAGDGVLGTTVADLETTLELQVTTTFRWARALTERLAGPATTDAHGPTRGALLATNSGSAHGTPGSLARGTARHGLRALTAGLADDLGPRGIHVCHLAVDGWIDRPALRERFPDHEAWMDPAAIAGTCWDLLTQPATAWTTEADLRGGADGRSW